MIKTEKINELMKNRNEDEFLEWLSESIVINLESKKEIDFFWNLPKEIFDFVSIDNFISAYNNIYLEDDTEFKKFLREKNITSDGTRLEELSFILAFLKEKEINIEKSMDKIIDAYIHTNKAREFNYLNKKYPGRINIKNAQELSNCFESILLTVLEDFEKRKIFENISTVKFGKNEDKSLMHIFFENKHLIEKNYDMLTKKISYKELDAMFKSYDGIGNTPFMTLIQKINEKTDPSKYPSISDVTVEMFSRNFNKITENKDWIGSVFQQNKNGESVVTMWNKIAERGMFKTYGMQDKMTQIIVEQEKELINKNINYSTSNVKIRKQRI